MRLILLSGGGGAGVTTLAAATALALATRGRRVRLLAADHAALGDILGAAGDGRPRLDATPPPPDAALGGDAPAVLAWLRALLAWAGVAPTLAADLARLPTARVAAALLAACESSDDAVVIDLGPAGEAFPILHLLATDPAVAIESDAVGRLAGRVAAPLLARLVDLPRPDAAARGAGHRLGERVTRLRALLRDPDAASLRLVLPGDDRDARIEREAATVCGLHGIGLDAVVTGGDRAGDVGVDSDRRRMPRRETPQGTPDLSAIARAVYGEGDPAAILARSPRPRIELTAAGADLVLPLPARPAAEFGVARRGSQLTVRAGAWRRTIILPPALVPLAGRRAWHDGDAFRVRFERPEEPA